MNNQTEDINAYIESILLDDAKDALVYGMTSIEEVTPLIWGFIKKYSKYISKTGINKDFEREDLFQDLCVICVNANNHFDTTQVNTMFSTYAWKSMINRIYELARKHNSKSRKAVTIESDYDHLQMVCENDLEEDIVRANMYAEALKMLTERELQVFQAKLNKIKQAYIAEILGVSQPRVSQIYSIAVKKMQSAMSD